MVDIEKLADEAEVIVQGYAFFRKGDGIHIIDLHRPTNYAHFSKDELVKTNMDDIEAFKVTKLYRNNVKYMEQRKLYK